MSLRLAVLTSCVCFVGCADGNAAPKSRDGELVLELGGNHASLRQALRAAGVEVVDRKRDAAPPLAEPAATRPRSQPEGPVPTDASLGGAAKPEHNPSPEPAQPAAKPPAPEAEFVYVELAEGQTLIHLARKHLGDGNRFREILTLNGWSEAASRRLKTGQRVKIPRTKPNSGRQ